MALGIGPGKQSSVLGAKDIPALAKYIKSDGCKNVYVMLGAGVSTSAGIPDFRSPETGLYANLARLNLPYPEAVFEINFFKRNPQPFYALARELYPGRFRPTPTHSFLKLLADKSLLRICFTQNIDTLERRAGVPASRIVEAHGSFAAQRCVACRRPYDDAKMATAVHAGRIPRCETCNALVKPDIVFFGEALPESFNSSVPALRNADLLLIMGTSLTVHPFASLVDFVPLRCPRVLINLDHVGDIGERPDDVVLLGKCDDVVWDLARELGWEAELESAWAETAASVSLDKEPNDVEAAEPSRQKSSDNEDGKSKTAKELLKDEVDELAEKVEAALLVEDSSGKVEEQGVPDVPDVDKEAASLPKVDLPPTKPSFPEPEPTAEEDGKKLNL
ncbi:NAD-dependent deacetylase sirtuin-2 [Auriscalpium vulgare]|uniref:NAD-dependent deacetylase sirtuin-2 n=1 Tax=Auriscalpium vulgare TaxID=40419 RepID=A0ACB8RDK3_9AGAM|nr:NAD-dependent deacetylase sirtuin-2 [Auriscalpium vulgare]